MWLIELFIILVLLLQYIFFSINEEQEASLDVRRMFG